MERRWTEGPWRGKEVSICDQDRAQLNLCFLSTTHQGHYEEGLANAHLIAAAPDLYEALEEMVMDWDDELPSDRQVDFVGRAREALSKARGE